jgi:ferric-dicitrate binding protein FerR (iron transport regulator)
MNITEALIERFFNNACDEAEQQAVKAYFIQHPEVLRKYMTESSWRAFEADKPVPGPVSEKMLSVIRQQTYRNRKVTLVRLWWAAAAAVLVFASGSYWLMQSNTAVPAKTVAKKEAVSPAPLPSIHLTSNTTTKPLALTLEDGTQVNLAPKSELSYPIPFQHDRRDLTLKGQAIFYVAKDASRPFTVHAGNLATTAIGTVFRITAFEGKTTSVHLLSGKVRVAPDHKANIEGADVTYLLPGQEIQLDVQQHLVVLNRKDKGHKPVLATAVKPATAPDSSIMKFHNEPLENIFNTLSEKYHTKIVFKAELLAGMTFTGKYDDQKESPGGFIQTICLLNNLVMREENGEIIIEGQ